MPELPSAVVLQDPLPAPLNAPVEAPLSLDAADVKLSSVPERVVSVRRSVATLEGRVFALARLGTSAGAVEAERFDLIEARNGLGAFRLLQSPLEVPLRSALVVPLGPAVSWTGGPTGTYSDTEGRFRLANVTVTTAPFLEVRAPIRGKQMRLFGVTRTREAVDGGLKVDLASTLVVREILRFWQRSNYEVTFLRLQAADVEPLLLRLRRLFQDGLPATVMEDVFEVNLPRGPWTPGGDLGDGAVRMLDDIARRDPDVSKEIDRLYTACNALLTGVRDPRRPQVTRPPFAIPQTGE